MIASMSWGLKAKTGMSGWPETIPSASESARSSIGYLLERVRKRGASLWGLSPSLPIAWQREQFSLTSASPLSMSVFSVAKTGTARLTRAEVRIAMLSEPLSSCLMAPRPSPL
jgi:hypothetical protein